MTPEKWAHLKSIFESALDQPIGARIEFLRRACGSDEELLREAVALIRSHETAGDFLESPPHVDQSPDTLEDGTTLGAFRIVRRIGHGGMGVVYLADDQELGRKVALKALPPGLAANSELRERLRREARAAAHIRHPSIATVYSLREIDDHLFIVSEYVEGTTLRALLESGRLEAERAYAIAVKIASALAAAHAAGVVHRDLKPENVIITADGEVKVVDFGIAVVEGLESARLTRQGAVLGTPGYMPPEQLLGGAVDARADVFAFGIVFAEMLSGRRPKTAADHQLIPPQFAALIATCTNASAAARYESGSALLKALSVESSPRGWWEFHQAAAALVYGVTTWPAWIGRQTIGGTTGRALFIAVLVAVIASAILRLHLWFTSRFYPGELPWARRRAGRWIRLADWVFVLALGATGALVGDDLSPVAVGLTAVAVGAAIAFLVIEPATARAAFRSGTPEGVPSARP
jgi:hypothetical protein